MVRLLRCLLRCMWHLMCTLGLLPGPVLAGSTLRLLPSTMSWGCPLCLSVALRFMALLPVSLRVRALWLPAVKSHPQPGHVGKREAAHAPCAEVSKCCRPLENLYETLCSPGLVESHLSNLRLDEKQCWCEGSQGTPSLHSH